MPSAGLGQMNFPSVRRFCIRRKPLPSYIKTLIVWAARPGKMKRWQHEGILTQHRLDLRGQAINAAAQVRATRRQVNTDTVRQPDHDRLSTTSSNRSKVAASKPRLTRTTQPPCRASSIRSSRGSGTLTAGSATWTVKNVASGPAEGAGASAARAFSREFQ